MSYAILMILVILAWIHDRNATMVKQQLDEMRHETNRRLDEMRRETNKGLDGIRNEIAEGRTQIRQIRDLM